MGRLIPVISAGLDCTVQNKAPQSLRSHSLFFATKKALAEMRVRRQLMFLQTPVDGLSEAIESEILLRGLSSTPRFIVWVESVKETGLRGRGGGIFY